MPVIQRLQTIGCLLGALALAGSGKAQQPSTEPSGEIAPVSSGKPLKAEAGSDATSTSPPKGANRGFLKALGGALGGDWFGGSQGAGAEGSAESEDKSAPTGQVDETQRKINELERNAQTNMEKGRLLETMKNVNDLIALKPYEPDFHLAMALCYRRDGKFSEALKKYQDVLDLGGPKALVSILKAEAYATEGSQEKVLQQLKEAAVGGRNIINDVALFPVLSVYQNDTEFIKLALHLEKIVVNPLRNTDPFTNTFPKPIDALFSGREKGASDAQISLTPEEQEAVVAEAKKTYEQVLIFIKLEDEGKAMKAYAALRDFIKKRDYIKVPKLVAEFKGLVDRLDNLEIEIEGIRLKYYYNLGQEKLKKMKELFNDSEYAGVNAVFGEITKLTQEMEQVNTRYKPVARRVQEAAGRWLTRAQVRQEFEARKPSIQGVIISSSEKMVVLNNQVIRVGDSIDDFRLVNVENNKVTFRYKGEEIPLMFRRY